MSGAGDLFCRIVAGAEPAAVVADEPDLLALLDNRPVFKGHVLIVPKRHVDTVLDLPPDLMAPMLELAQRVARAQEEVLNAQGTFMAMNNVISQSVPHLHLHVVPRRAKDGLRGFFWPRTTYDDEAATTAESLARVLGRPEGSGSVISTDPSGVIRTDGDQRPDAADDH